MEVDPNDPAVLRTTHLPVYRQYRLQTRDHVEANLDELIRDPIRVPTEIKHARERGMRSLQKAVEAGDIPRARVKQLVKAAYKTEVDIFGRAYARKIDRLVDEFYARVVAEDFTAEPYCYISRGLERLGLGHPMRSLRDTDIPVKIELA